MDQKQRIKELEKLQTKILDLSVDYGELFKVDQNVAELTRMLNFVHEETMEAIVAYPYICPHCNQSEGYREIVTAFINSDFDEFHDFKEESREFTDKIKPSFICNGCEVALDQLAISAHKTKRRVAKDELEKILSKTKTKKGFWNWLLYKP